MFIVFLLTIPFAAVILLVAMLVVVTISTVRFTSPIGVITSIGAPKLVIKRNYCFSCVLATDQYLMTISRAHVSTHCGDVIYLEAVR